MDKLTECKRCKGNACYEQQVNEDTTTWLCLGCGFTTSTLMDKDGSLTANTLETSPELYKDLMFIDDLNRAWFPATVTLPAKGMVFIDGTSKSDWRWAAVRAIEISEEDRKIKQFPSNQTHRMDMQKVKHFNKKDFMDALEVIDFYAV